MYRRMTIGCGQSFTGRRGIGAATRLDDLSSIPRTYGVAGEHLVLHTVLQLPQE